MKIRFLAALFAISAIALTSRVNISRADMAEERPWPNLNRTLCRLPRACNRADFVSILVKSNLSDLTSPAGGRAYRVIFLNFTQGWSLKPVPKVAYVEAVIGLDGSGELRSGGLRPDRCRNSMHIGVADLAAFETSLSKTDFDKIPEPEDSHIMYLDYPPETLLEAYVGGKYHYVHIVGPNHADVQEAWMELAKLACP